MSISAPVRGGPPAGNAPKPFTKDSPGRVPFKKGPQDPELTIYKNGVMSKIRMRRARHEAHLDRLDNMAMGKIRGVPAMLQVQIAAAREFADRVVGKPLQTSVTSIVRRSPAEFTDDELLALAGSNSGYEGDSEA